jgi:hypothetical protein
MNYKHRFQTLDGQMQSALFERDMSISEVLRLSKATPSILHLFDFRNHKLDENCCSLTDDIL